MDSVKQLWLRRSEPESRAVLSDWLEERGITLALFYDGYGDGDGGYGDGGYGDGDGGYGDGGYGNGDGGYGDGGCGDGDGGDGGYGDGDGGYGGYGDGYGDGDGGDGYGGDYMLKQGELEMTPGLKIVVLGHGTYSYVLIGWVRQIVGDEYVVVGARCMKRFGRNKSLAWLAENGPFNLGADDGTKLLEAATRPEEIHRLMIRRSLPCNEATWAKECPRPADWIEATPKSGRKPI